MAFHITLTSARTTMPDPVVLLAAVKTATGDPTAVLLDPFRSGQWSGKKATAWTAPQIAAVQNLLDTTPAETPQIAAQRTIDQWPLELQAAFLLVMKQFNVLRALHGLPALTKVQFMKAIRDEVAEL